MASGTLKTQNTEFHSFSASDPNINLLNNPRCLRNGKIINISFAIRYSTINNSFTEITAYDFPWTSAMNGVAVYGTSVIEGDTGSIPELCIEVYNGKLRAKGGKAGQVYLCNFSYILW